MQRVRLLKVTVQATFAVDDGTDLLERQQPPHEIPAAAWPDYPARLEELRAEAERELNAPPDPDAQGNGQPANREQRRAAAKRARPKAKR